MDWRGERIKEGRDVCMSASGAISRERPDREQTVIEPLGRWSGLNWGELASQRELLAFFLLRDFKVRYKQTALGIIWVVLQPLVTMGVFTMVFGRLVRGTAGALPYPLLCLSGLVPWFFFSNGVAQASQTLVNQNHLLTKIYFPRLYLPLSPVCMTALDALVGLAILCVAGAVWGKLEWTPAVGLLPIVGGVLFLLTLGLGAWFAAWMVLYRDFRHLVPFGLQTLLFLSPVVYPGEILGEGARRLLILNPMYGLIGGFRSALFGAPVDWAALGVAVMGSTACFLAGVMQFRALERKFADLV
jgi:lipopolysaccharide transport system permease protein